MDISRQRLITKCQNFNKNGNCVFYWMSRDQRVQDNWALIRAQELAKQNKVPLKVVFNLVPKFLEATLRQYQFMIDGLKEVESDLHQLNIPMYLTQGWPSNNLPDFFIQNKPTAVVCDMSPLRVPMQWVKEVGKSLDDRKSGIPLFQVDAHNVVPVWVASQKKEVGARTIRGKITNLLGQYLKEFPVLEKQVYDLSSVNKIDWQSALDNLEINRDVKAVDWLKGGSKQGLKVLDIFCKEKLKNFDKERNDPNKNVLSNLGPYFHFGQVSAQRSSLKVKEFQSRFGEGVKVYLEESIIRRELSDNFCFYEENYDNLKGGLQWAQDTLEVHKKDKRDYIYELEEWENSQTHDPLWNACQNQMVQEGKMHGYMRMYWAKKFLEWSETPEKALQFAIYLNDKYSIDGRDPNGYVGCMWSIVGLHDQGWGERNVFGKIRFMNYQGCQRKFDVSKFQFKYKGNPETNNKEKKKKAESQIDIKTAFKKLKTKEQNLTNENQNQIEIESEKQPDSNEKNQKKPQNSFQIFSQQISSKLEISNIQDPKLKQSTILKAWKELPEKNKKQYQTQYEEAISKYYEMNPQIKKKNLEDDNFEEEKKLPKKKK